jgi:O-antigen ligase
MYAMQQLLDFTKRYLIYILTAYVLVDYYFRNSGGSFMASIWDELLFLIIIGVWLLLIGIKKAELNGSKLLLPLLLFYTAVFFTFLIKNGEVSVAVMELRSLVQYTFWFFIGLNLVNSKEQFKNICDIFLLIGMVVALYGIYQYITGAEIPSTWVDQAEGDVRSRAFSFVGSPNVLGSFLILHISIAFASFMAAQHWFKKRVYLGLSAISFLCLIFTLSRAAWLVFALAFLLLALWLDKRIIIALIILAIITPIAVPSVANRITYMLSPEYISSSSEGGRIARWTQALEYWRGEPETVWG